MAGVGDGDQSSSSKPTIPPPSVPTISLSPRASVDLFSIDESGLSFNSSPGPMALASSFFSDHDDGQSFTQLLTRAPCLPSPGVMWGSEEAEIRDSSAIIDSRGFFSMDQEPFELMQQQTPAQATVQAGRSNSVQLPPYYHHLSSSIQQPPVLVRDVYASVKEFLGISEPDQISQPPSYTARKPDDDGFNWKKYGQKQVKGTEFLRSYYRCANPGCAAKKKVERSTDGGVIEIVYEGQHNHDPPLPNKRETNPDENSNLNADFELSGSSDGEKMTETENGEDERDEDERDPKRRCIEMSGSSSQREPEIAFQTTSEIDVLKDGYRWRKYGKKIVKGHLHARSYYRCTAPGCSVRKHIERATADRRDVVTTYKGRHNHVVPKGRT